MAGKVLKWTNGWAGQVSRSIDDIIEAFANADTNPILFGSPVALVSGNVKNVSADNTAVIGVAVRTVKTEQTYGQGDAKYMPNEMVDVLKRGTVCMDAGSTTPAAGGTVYITKATGKIATAADSSNTIETNWKFKGAKDANNIVEVVLTERAF